MPLKKIYNVNKIFKTKTWYCGNLAHRAYYKVEFSELAFALNKTLIPFKHRALNHSTAILIQIPDETFSVNPPPCSIDILIWMVWFLQNIWAFPQDYGLSWQADFNRDLLERTLEESALDCYSLGI